ncbi:hypothetical protein KIPB_013706, partial [Kipferlia bialata]|eukprot:g13706.t1
MSRNPEITGDVPAVNHIPIEAQHGAFDRFQKRCSRSERPECSYHLSTAVKSLQAECIRNKQTTADPLSKARAEKLVPLFQGVIDVVAKEAEVPTLRVRAIKGSMCDMVVGRGVTLLQVKNEPGQGGEVLACLVQSAAAAYHSPVATFACSLCATQLTVSGFIFRDQVYYGPLLSIDLASDTASVAWVLESLVLGALELEKEREEYEESGYDTHYMRSLVLPDMPCLAQQGIELVAHLDRGVYRASGCQVVKVTNMYDEGAYKHLAGLGFAPELREHHRLGHRCGDGIIPYSVLVMRDLTEDGFVTLSRILVQAMTSSEIDMAFSELRRVLTALHSGGYVFGDLRAPNVM